MLKGKLTPTRFLQGTISKVAEVVGSNIQPLTIRNNGTYEALNGVDGFNPVYVDTPEPKEEQEKTITITDNGITEVLPDNDKALSRVTVDVQVECGEKPVDLVSCVTRANQMFYGAKTFPPKVAVNLTNATDVYRAFAYWNTEPIPVVEELTVSAPSVNVSNNQACMGQMFCQNQGVKKVILNMPNECRYMRTTFKGCSLLEEVVLNFSTKNVVEYKEAFGGDRKLKRIIGAVDFTSADDVSYMFDGCNELETVRFAPNTLSISISLSGCGKLVSESIQSIVEGLATVTSAQTLTLAKATVLTDEQKATINAKGWTLAQ